MHNNKQTKQKGNIKTNKIRNIHENKENKHKPTTNHKKESSNLRNNKNCLFDRNQLYTQLTRMRRLC